MGRSTGRVWHDDLLVLCRGESREVQRKNTVGSRTCTVSDGYVAQTRSY
jgi:hypothetical protein